VTVYVPVNATKSPGTKESQDPSAVASVESPAEAESVNSVSIPSVEAGLETLCEPLIAISRMI